MPRYIDADPLMQEDFSQMWNDVADQPIFEHIIEQTPTADVVEIRHGRWIKPTKINGRNFAIPHCSVCEGVPCGVDENTLYCPNCGAIMDGKE